MASSSSLAQWSQRGLNGGGSNDNLETVEMDPQLASGMGLKEGDIVRYFQHPYL